MRYIFNEDLNKSIEDRILQLNNINANNLDVSNFQIDKDIEAIESFKNKILSNKDSKFFIVGDYDCDGICATAIIKKLFDDLGIKCNYYIPSRTKEGYGLNNNIVNTAYQNNFDCLFCVDNGIIAKEQLKLAKSLGLKVFIIDHHEYQEDPICESFLHPKLFNNKYSDMCAAGLCALFSSYFIDDNLINTLGGIASLADMVSMLNYNRYLVKKMINILNNYDIRPIKLLLGDNKVSATNIQFNVIPKINAVSRLDDMLNVNYVVKYLLANDVECFDYFNKIETINTARKDLSKQMYDLACRLIDDKDNVIVIKHTQFKEGLCGIIANRILDNYQKPAIVFSEINGVLKGSGRSLPGTNMYEYLKNINNLFDNYGGHELAVGLQMNVDNYEKLIAYIKNKKLEYNEQYIDVLVLDESKINETTLQEIDRLQPYGTNFKQPLFALKNPKYQSKYLVANKYPKFDINDNLSAISFNTSLVNKSFEYMIGSLKTDNYYKDKLSFVIEDLL